MISTGVIPAAETAPPFDAVSLRRPRYGSTATFPTPDPLLAPIRTR